MNTAATTPFTDDILEALNRPTGKAEGKEGITMTSGDNASAGVRNSLSPTYPQSYPFNHWWIAGRSAEVESGKILSRRLLGIDVAFYRRQGGEVAAVEDRCAHRGVPLSMGSVEGDNLVCRYHGFRYAPDGRCVMIPTQEKIPAKARVRSFPVVEHAPFLWIWMGDPALADASKAPDYPWMRDEAWSTAVGYTAIACNWMMLKENVLDLTHFSYLHAATFEMDGEYGEPSEYAFEDGIVKFRQNFIDKPLPPAYTMHSELKGRRFDRYDEGASLSPAEHSFLSRIVDRQPQPGQPSEYFMRFLHLTTPETPTSMHYWWVMGRDHARNPEALAAITDVTHRGFEEDRVMLEALQRQVDAHGGSIAEVSVLADQAGLQARRQLQMVMKNG